MAKYQGGRLLSPLSVDYKNIAGLSTPTTGTRGTGSGSTKEPDTGFKAAMTLEQSFKDEAIANSLDEVLNNFHSRAGEFLVDLNSMYGQGLLGKRDFEGRRDRMLMGYGKLLREIQGKGKIISDYIANQAQKGENAEQDQSIMPYLDRFDLGKDLLGKADRVFGLTSSSLGYSGNPGGFYKPEQASTTDQPKEKTAAGRFLQKISKVPENLFKNKNPRKVRNQVSNEVAIAPNGDLRVQVTRKRVNDLGQEKLGHFEGTEDAVFFDDFKEASENGGYRREDFFNGMFFGNSEQAVLDTGEERETRYQRHARYIEEAVLPGLEDFFEDVGKGNFTVGLKKIGLKKNRKRTVGITITNTKEPEDSPNRTKEFDLRYEFFGKPVKSSRVKRFKNKIANEIREFVGYEDEFARYYFPDGRKVIARKALIDSISRGVGGVETGTGSDELGGDGKEINRFEGEGQQADPSQGPTEDAAVTGQATEAPVETSDADGNQVLKDDADPNVSNATTYAYFPFSNLTEANLAALGSRNFLKKGAGFYKEVEDFVMNAVDAGFLYDKEGNIVNRQNINPITMGEYVTYGYIQDPENVDIVKEKVEKTIKAFDDNELHQIFSMMGGRDETASDYDSTVGRLIATNEPGQELEEYAHLKNSKGRSLKIKAEDFDIKDYNNPLMTPNLSERQNNIARAWARDYMYSAMSIRSETKTYKPEDKDSSKDKTTAVEEVTFVQEPVLDNMTNIVTSLLEQEGATVEQARASNYNEPVRTITDITERLAPYEANGYKFGKMNLIHTITLPEELYTQLNKKFGTINGINDKPMEVRNLSVFMIPGQGGQEDQFAMVFGGQVSLEKIRRSQGVIIAGEELESVATETPVEDTYSYIANDTFAAYTFNALKDVLQFREAVDPMDYDPGANFTEKTFFTLQNIRNK